MTVKAVPIARDRTLPQSRDGRQTNLNFSLASWSAAVLRRFSILGSKTFLLMIELRWLKFLATFQRHFGFEVLYVAANARDGCNLVVRRENHRRIFRF